MSLWQEMYKLDEFRYFGPRGATWLQRRSRPALRYMRVFRQAQAAAKLPHTVEWFTSKVRLASMARKWHFQIPPEAEVGPGLYLGHIGAIVVNPAAKIGRNVNLAHGVTIGEANRGRLKGSPTLGDSVWVGTGATVVGRVSIGNDVLIAPNSYLNFDVPDHSIVIGNPARVIARENATQGYVNNLC